MKVPTGTHSQLRTRGILASLLAIAALCLACACTSQAHITDLASFNYTNGQFAYAGLTLSGDGGTLYGTTSSGGVNTDGNVFSVPVGGGMVTTLATFNGANGQYPYAGLTLIGSTLYGTTYEGGANLAGTVFSVPVGGGTPTTLATFNGTNGATPYAGLTLSADGSTLYGTTQAGGANSDGTVFSVPVGGGTVTTLATFNGTNGNGPSAGLTLSGGILYGTTQQGGANSAGTVFSVPVSGGTITDLASFNNTNGANPFGDLTLSGSTLYGTTSTGGANGDGVVFSVPTSAPEPGSAALLALGAGAVLGWRRRRISTAS